MSIGEKLPLTRKPQKQKKFQKRNIFNTIRRRDYMEYKLANDNIFFDKFYREKKTFKNYWNFE